MRARKSTLRLVMQRGKKQTLSSTYLPGQYTGATTRRPPGNRDLRSDDGDGNGNATKAIGLISKTTILHVHLSSLYISLSSLHDYDVKMPYFTFYGGRKQATTKFSLSF